MGKEICLITVNYNDWKTTEEFVVMVSEFQIIDHIIVVDNKSTDESYDKLKTIEGEKVTVIQSKKNGGYGAGNNYGMKYAHRKYSPELFVISNSDIIFTNDLLKEMIKTLRESSDVSVVAPKMQYPDGRYARNTAWRIPESFLYTISS